MRIAAGLLASATLLFATGALGLIGPWALVAGVVLAVVAAVTTVVVMEERENVAPARQPATYAGRLDITA
jgi:CBS-domain-containing membrane protein